jgi:hypothetical protein
VSGWPALKAITTAVMLGSLLFVVGLLLGQLFRSAIFGP